MLEILHTKTRTIEVPAKKVTEHELWFRGELLTDLFDKGDTEIIELVVQKALDLATTSTHQDSGGQTEKDYGRPDGLRDVTESVASDGWRSIDSAPKGDELGAPTILIWEPDWSIPLQGFWQADKGNWWIRGLDLGLDPTCHPTHWMPLPKAPSGEKQDETEASSVTPRDGSAGPINPISNLGDSGERLAAQIQRILDAQAATMSPVSLPEAKARLAQLFTLLREALAETDNGMEGGEDV
jgi:hypothetical protein